MAGNEAGTGPSRASVSNHPGDSRRYHPGMEFSLGEILFIVAIAVVLAAVIGGYMVFTRRKGWM